MMNLMNLVNLFLLQVVSGVFILIQYLILNIQNIVFVLVIVISNKWYFKKWNINSNKNIVTITYNIIDLLKTYNDIINYYFVDNIKINDIII